MEEFENKLTSKNPIFLTRAVSQLVDAIKQKFNPEEPNKKLVHDSRELKFLLRKCASSSSLISSTAASAILTLVEDNILDFDVTISELVSLLMTADGYTGLVHALCKLTYQDRAQNFKYNLIVRQHPLISILLHHPSAWPEILDSFETYMITNDFKTTHYPFLLYVFCDYNKKISNDFKHRLWNLLVEHLFFDYELFDVLISWLKYDDKENLWQYNICLREYLNTLNGHELYEEYFNVVVLLLASSNLELVKKNMNPTLGLYSLMNAFNVLKVHNCVNCLVYMAAESILVSSVFYLEVLLAYSKLLLETKKVHPIMIMTLKASCLHCALNCSELTKRCESLLNEIITYEITSEMPVKKINHLYNSPYLKSYQNILVAIEINDFCENWNENDILTWLKSLRNTPEVILKKLQSFLFGLLLCKFKNKDINLEVINILNTCIECYPDLSSNFLTITLFKLANCRDSQVLISLLKTLPKLAVVKENVGRIVSTLQVLSTGNHPSLKTLALKLFFDLWKTQVMSYPLLQNALSQNVSNFEFNTTKAFVLMQLCKTKPEGELAAHLSKILNKCSGSEGATASSLALLGLKYFCQQGLVDISTVWPTLEPNIAQERRPEVLISLCDLLSEVATLPDNLGQYNDFIKEITERLWKYATYENDVQINTAAYTSLSAFTLEQVSINIPSVLDDDTIVPDGFGFIPGSCWLKLLHMINYTALDALGDLLISLIEREINGYIKGIYHTNENRREPSNLNYLQVYSIVRTLGNYLKDNSTKFGTLENKDVYLQVLRIFSKEYPKPLPPLDWCFLQELMHDTSTRHFATKIASKQVILSGTARRLVENFIVSVTNSVNGEDDIMLIYENLIYLLNSIQPMLMEPFFANTLEYILRHNSKILQDALKIVAKLLNDAQIQSVNKDVIFRIFAGEFKKMNLDSEHFEMFMSTIVHAPEQYLEELIQINAVTMGIEELKLAIMIRSRVLKSQKDPQFSLINDVVFHLSTVPSLHNFFLKECMDVFRVHRENVASYDWFCEFLGQVQLCLADGKYTTELEISYLCDVFTLSVIVICGCEIYGNVLERNIRLKLFPTTLEIILHDKEWSKSNTQILEWLYYMITEQNLPNLFLNSFESALIALKHTDVFSESHKWTKYVSISIKNVLMTKLLP